MSVTVAMELSVCEALNGWCATKTNRCATPRDVSIRTRFLRSAGWDGFELFRVGCDSLSLPMLSAELSSSESEDSFCRFRSTDLYTAMFDVLIRAITRSEWEFFGSPCRKGGRKLSSPPMSPALAPEAPLRIPRSCCNVAPSCLRHLLV